MQWKTQLISRWGEDHEIGSQTPLSAFVVSEFFRSFSDLSILAVVIRGSCSDSNFQFEALAGLLPGMVEVSRMTIQS